MNLMQLVSTKLEDTHAAYTFRDSILYALSVGFDAKPYDPLHLKFLYEEELCAVPTMANVLGHSGMWMKNPIYEVDWKQMLHAEQRLTLSKTIQPQAKIRAEHAITGVRDRGADLGAFVYQSTTIFDAETDEEIACIDLTILFRKDGGCGDWGEAPEQLPNVPEREPDASINIETKELDPLLYRLNGDYNPIHVDPAIARSAGFPRPILHGLATKGLACYAILRTFCGFDPTRLTHMAVRFSGPVLPGDKLRFDFWTSADQEIRFRACVPERDVIVLDRCTVGLH